VTWQWEGEARPGLRGYAAYAALIAAIGAVAAFALLTPSGAAYLGVAIAAFAAIVVVLWVAYLVFDYLDGGGCVLIFLIPLLLAALLDFASYLALIIGRIG
jgi:fructose-specific phosphotransferase system IIC component